MQNLFDQLAIYTKAHPAKPMTQMWRAVFALSYVDGGLAAQEMGFVDRVMQRFNFSDEQRKLVYDDIIARPQPALKFKAITDESYKSQFFRLARILIWCDGFLHSHEREIIEAFKSDLGDQVSDYEADFRWLDRKPEMPLGIEAKDELEALEIMIVYQMLAFLKELEVAA